MLARICDFCGRIVPDRFDTIFEVNGYKFRFAVIKVSIKNGVRWKEADVCGKCMEKCRTGRYGKKKK